MNFNLYSSSFFFHFVGDFRLAGCSARLAPFSGGLVFSSLVFPS